MKKILIGILVSALLPYSLSAQAASKAGTSAAQFLKIPVGAKAAAMANAFSAVADNATALYWNPAGIASLERMEGSLSHLSWIAGLTHDFIGVVVPVGERSAFGASATILQSEKIEQTTIDEPEGTGRYFDAFDMAIGVSYARAMTDFVDIGATVKYINQRIWSETAQNFGFDFGALLRTGYKDLKLGFSFQNFGPGMSMSGRELIRQLDQDPASTSNPYIQTRIETQEWDLPTSYRMSSSVSLVGSQGIIQSEISHLLIAIDAIHPTDNPEHYSIGGEYEFDRTFAIRGGYVFQTDEEGMTLGAGVKVPVGGSVFSFDYAYAAFGVLGSVQYFTLNAAF
jgi:hypothetical protein